MLAKMAATSLKTSASRCPDRLIRSRVGQAQLGRFEVALPDPLEADFESLPMTRRHSSSSGERQTHPTFDRVQDYLPFAPRRMPDKSLQEAYQFALFLGISNLRGVQATFCKCRPVFERHFSRSAQ